MQQWARRREAQQTTHESNSIVDHTQHRGGHDLLRGGTKIKREALEAGEAVKDHCLTETVGGGACGAPIKPSIGRMAPGVIVDVLASGGATANPPGFPGRPEASVAHYVQRLTALQSRDMSEAPKWCRVAVRAPTPKMQQWALQRFATLHSHGVHANSPSSTLTHTLCSFPRAPWISHPLSCRRNRNVPSPNMSRPFIGSHGVSPEFFAQKVSTVFKLWALWPLKPQTTSFPSAKAKVVTSANLSSMYPSTIRNWA